jgi:hypothetical protein
MHANCHELELFFIYVNAMTMQIIMSHPNFLSGKQQGTGLQLNKIMLTLDQN